MPKQLSNAFSYGSYSALFQAVKEMAQDYGSMPIENVYAAFARASMTMNPQIQNRRVKAISSIPTVYGKDKVAEMIKSPDGNELALRQTAHALEWSAYPYFKIRKTYQDINTDRFFFYPAYLESDEIDDAFWREGKLLDNFNSEMKPDQWAHQIRGQTFQEGKVFYVPRYEIDKAHNKVNYAFMQQLPSDYCKIVGFNNVSKYTVMFDMMYLLQPGADWRQFGDLLLPYLDDFNSIFETATNVSSNYIFASTKAVKTASGSYLYVNMAKHMEIREKAAGKPQLYNQSGRWAYWVTLPVDKVWVFEIDDTLRTAATPLTWLFLAMDQLAAYEAVQLELVQNPLVSVLLGEIPYDDTRQENSEDKYKLSIAGRTMFEAFWYQMLAAANTGGIGVYSAPFQNMKLVSLSEAPNATDISTKGYQYAVSKSGMSGLIPINDNPRAGSVNISAALEERYSQTIYSQMENMMNHIYKSMKLKHKWRFKMFGGFSTEEKLLKQAKEGMASGILSDVFLYYAIRGISIFSDLAMSRMIKKSGILDLRIPLISGYNVSRKDGTLPPQPDNNGGRPSKELGESVEDGSDGNEDSIDNGE